MVKEEVDGKTLNRGRSMKCIQRGNGRILHVSNTVAEQKVENEGYRYVDKTAYKKQKQNQRNGTTR
jgi:hypothetical protein